MYLVVVVCLMGRRGCCSFDNTFIFKIVSIGKRLFHQKGFLKFCYCYIPLLKATLDWIELSKLSSISKEWRHLKQTCKFFPKGVEGCGWYRSGLSDIFISLILEKRLESILKIFDSLEIHSRRLYFLLDNCIMLHTKNDYVSEIKTATTCEALSRASVVFEGRLQNGPRELQHTSKRDDWTPL